MLAPVGQSAIRLVGLAAALLYVLVPSGADTAVIYRYDPLGRIATALYDNGLCVVYLYDANGNRTSQTIVAAPQSPPQWGSVQWGAFNWTVAPQWPVWGSGAWGCFNWTP
jgi:YD repeat-containing protein